MKPSLLIALFVLPFQLLNAQNVFLERFLHSEQKKIEKFTLPQNDSIYSLASPFAKSSVENKSLTSWLERYNIRKITLLYTTFRESEQFNQEALNKQRIIHLQGLLSTHLLFPEFEIIAQTGCKRKEEGPDFFHGFLLYGSKKPDRISILNEIGYLNHYLASSIPNFSKPDLSSSILPIETHTITEVAVSETRDLSKFSCPEYPGGFNALRSYIERNRKQPNIMNEYLYTGYVKTKCYLTERGDIKTVSIEETPGKWQWIDDEVFRLIKNMPTWNPAKYDGKAEANFIYLSIYIGPTFQPTLVDCEKPKETIVEGAEVNFKDDSLVSAVLNRNKWKKKVIVCDITGSMITYNATLMKWLYEEYKTNAESVEGIVFFNDGDQKKDDKKKIGKTGGIYSSASLNFEEIIALMEKAMLNGGGGDIPENNIEALLHAKSTFSSAKEFILVADNVATPRDLSLMYDFKQPVHIILCGTRGRINPDYLNLARQTKGSVHFANEDIDDLHQLQEGTVFELEGTAFRIAGGKIIDAY